MSNVRFLTDSKARRAAAKLGSNREVCNEYYRSFGEYMLEELGINTPAKRKELLIAVGCLQLADELGEVVDFEMELDLIKHAIIYNETGGRYGTAEQC